jgi:tetratricopeptide (TPR) repeat protein
MRSLPALAAALILLIGGTLALAQGESALALGLLLICALLCAGYLLRLAYIIRHPQYRRAASLKQLNEHITRNPRNPLSYARRAAIRFYEGDAEGALSDYNTALEQNIIRLDRWGFIRGIEATIYTERGQVHFAREEYLQALKDFQTAHKSQPHYHPALAWLAITCYALRRFDEARQWWRAACDNCPEYRSLDGTNWVPEDENGWLHPEIVSAQALTALLNASQPELLPDLPGAMDSSPS